MRFTSIATLAWSLSSSLWSASAADDDSKKAGPPFFLIDSSDQLCLAGEEFKRCSIDTLWFVTGTAGKFRIVIRTKWRFHCHLRDILLGLVDAIGRLFFSLLLSLLLDFQKGVIKFTSGL